jgi:4a-hydroxytetrahydrobiopterin dehydratase
MAKLCEMKCRACRGGVEPFKGDRIKPYLQQLDGNWQVEEEKRLVRSFSFPDFAKALAFVNRVGALAEAEGHHPDISLSWGKVKISLMTHKIGGLWESDFILAAKIDTLPID